MSSITQHTTRRLSHCYWRFELRAHRALCLESRVLSGARDDVGSLDSLAGGCAGVGFDSRVDAKTVLHTALTVSHSITLCEIVYAFLPYVKGVTDTIGHLLRRRYSIRTIFRPPGQLRNLLRSPKDKDPLAVPGVYMIPCDCGSSYIGETRRNITTRLKEHIRSVKNRDTHTSAVAEHACSAGTTHFLRFDKVSVLAREKYFVPRKVREAIEISRRPNFNRDGGWALPPAWKPSLQSASAYNVAGLECDTVSAVCNTVFASTRESNPTPAQPPASESNEPTSSRAPDSTRDSRQRARWARSSNRQ
ncbi:hypothetical protein SFRURICE_004253 [Spodoptera frugiperda]|nr:hypothetical protein SFRURICE_004253 [Spodoptera frugiperda]